MGTLTNFLVIEKPISKLKNYCLQIAWHRPYLLYIIFDAELSLLSYDNNIFSAGFVLFSDFFHIRINWNRKTDHAGFRLDITLLGFMFEFTIYDTRHWDEENDCWQKY